MTTGPHTGHRNRCHEAYARPTGSPCPARNNHSTSATLRELQQQLSRNQIDSLDQAHHAPEVHWAATEASALSWTTPFPLLFYPALFEEKVASALERARRQDRIHQRSRELLGL